jgi:hypothetical protein
MNNTLYIHSTDNKYRYVLGNKGINPLIVFGINPSIAEPIELGKSDPTIEKIKRISNKLGYDTFIMLNLYPQRATNPNDLDRLFNQEIHQRNLIEIEKILKEFKHHHVIGAWGNLIHKRAYLKTCLEDINELVKKYEMKWMCFDINQSGQPKHPLYVKEETIRLKSYSIKSEKE